MPDSGRPSRSYLLGAFRLDVQGALTKEQQRRAFLCCGEDLQPSKGIDTVGEGAL